MIKLTAILIFISLTGVACAPKTQPIQPGQNVVCTQDAKLCPDGSAVGRTGPNCEFPACPTLPHQAINSADIASLAGPFNFTAEIPAEWRAEAVPAIEAINIYDPISGEKDNLGKSQIFIRHFTANDFLTLSTVTIFNRQETTLNGRPAVIYNIEKKSGVANFVSQPTWRNARHLVTDIRSSEASPALFYVIAKRPELSQEVFDRFLQSLVLNQVPVTNSDTNPVPPIADYRARVTKKPFGIYITPDTSPVSPEKFTGWHTGIDVEYGDVAGDVPVYAVSDGKILRADWVSGYGGMVAVTQEINGVDYVAIFGHLDPVTLPKVGDIIKAGNKIGILGDGFTNETDGERKHLHFALFIGSNINVHGYVQNQTELTGWVDPLKVLP